MGVGAGLYMYDVVAKTFTFAISSTDKFLFAPGSTKMRLVQPSLDNARARVSSTNPRYGRVAEAFHYHVS